MSKLNFYSKLSTEQINPASKNLDRLSIEQAFRIINKEDAKIPKLVWNERASIERAVKLIVSSLQAKGRLFLLGAGTSGRFAVMEAAECPPTFNTPPSLVQAFMAGGRSSVFRSKEGSEDKGQDAVRLVNKNVRAGDVVVGIAASGVTAYVKEGLLKARRKKAKTIFVTCNSTPPKNLADVTIRIKTGPEVITGSTRLKAGTATKLVLNSLTVLSMTSLGKVFGNRMVDLQPRSKKLEARALNLIVQLGRVSEKKAQALMKESKGNAKTAILMALKGIGRAEAIGRLAKANGHLSRALRPTSSKSAG